MHEDEYVKFATETEKGGKIAKSEALKNWAEWKEAALAPGSAWPAKDEKGPASSKLRIAVKVRDCVHFENVTEHTKSLQSKGKERKDLSNEQIESAKAALFKKQGAMGSMAEQGNLQEIAGNMVRAGGEGQAFSSGAWSVGDLG
eukprot:14195381-Alexandrium_andersonii.AAC.1